MKKGIIAISLAAAFLMVAGVPGFAADPQGWKFELTPYLWYAGLEGDITVMGHEADFEKSASDLVDYVEAGGSFLAVVQYNRLLFWGDVDYFSLSTDALDVEDQPKGGRLDTDMLLWEAAFGYQIDGFAEGQTIDLMVGIRTLRQENDLEVFGNETIPPKTFSTDDTISDPIFVVRPSIPIFPSKVKGLRFNPTLAIGGGGDADLVYELFPQIQYQITDNIAARLGYRTVGYKFSDDYDNELNFNMSGLIAGVGITF